MGFRSLCATSLGALASLPVAKRSIPFAIAAGLAFSSTPIFAQNFNNNGFFGRAVGGVRIDADGVMRTITEEDATNALEQTRADLVGPTGELQQSVDLRLISLQGIRNAVQESIATGKALPEEVMFLGGLTRVEKIFVYPERNDIVLAGPAEPWSVGPNGAIVGAKSGKPTVHLDDLLNAFKTVESARQTGISVSIEPTKEGSARLTQLLSQNRINASQVNWQSLEAAMRQAFGPQQVKLEGVAPDSHMARVILAADYKMKLYGMNLVKAPVSGLPSYLEMVSNSASKNLQSRWWMACDYSSIEHSKDKLAWQLTGNGIKTLTEVEQISSDGTRVAKGKADPIAKKWADLFTSKLDELAVKEPVFGELRNVMDLCVVAAIIESQGLEDIAGCDLSSLLGEKASVQLNKVEFPTSLDPQCSFVRTAQGFLVSASGGVMVDSWNVVASVSKENEQLSTVDSGKIWKNDQRIWQ
ncbi:DUF1598 domain-containing protein [Pirellulaceae bacterium SH467]